MKGEEGEKKMQYDERSGEWRNSRVSAGGKTQG